MVRTHGLKCLTTPLYSLAVEHLILELQRGISCWSALQAAAAAYLHTWLSTRTALSVKTGDSPEHLGRVFLERIILGLPNRVERGLRVARGKCV